MYDSGTLVRNDTPDIKTQPELEAIHNRLKRQNETAASIIYEIEEKLHSILSLRTPEKIPENKSEKSANDFVSSTHEQSNITEQNICRLEKVLIHVKKIIG